MEIHEARFPEHLEVTREIFREYAESLNIDLTFQEFASELAVLPGKYAAPAGRILLAWDEAQVIGCVAMRPLEGDACEMKRLYVRPSGRGMQVGKRLARVLCHVAQEVGYARIRLDTLPSMGVAQRIYRSLGFKQIPAYVFNPIEGTQYLELTLT
ncbi:MAG: GNAT family N-acetyltransferase [Magnetococcales bacterium]|nr:GNAT family N-acetyltransferase [Magnetococcales bacterium]MBF0116553.1 GNAT family N-acetyltransferase [Magnetococcales bacterium]